MAGEKTVVAGFGGYTGSIAEESVCCDVVGRAESFADYNQDYGAAADDIGLSEALDL